ncbi:MAG: hypothetical protein JSV85_00140 [Candidatus Bathyarchaeota archaeon]|nr:MAG: hypothetical protein JSV85_00140 [Candidatus Bathyarchaeota archaeon]
MGERPRLIKFFAIFYGSYAFLCALFLISLWTATQGIQPPPEPPTYYPIERVLFAVFLGYIFSLGGVFLSLLVAYGLPLAKEWARMLGLVISVVTLLLVLQGTMSSDVGVLTGFFVSGSFGFLTRLIDVSYIILSIAAIFYLKRSEVVAYFEKKRISEGSPKAFLKKCVRCDKDIPLASEECPHCGAKQKER